MTHNLSISSRQKSQEYTFDKEVYSTFATETQSTNFQSYQVSAKKKFHNPLNTASSNYLAKSASSPFYPENMMISSVDSTDVTHSCVASEPINRSSYLPVIEHLDLVNFKIKPCPINTQHNHKHCPFYHNGKDRKRPGFFYSAELCDYAEKETVNCPNGDMCQKAHNRVEQLYRPDKYKTKFCTFYPHNLEKCDYGVFCSFAHNECDIAIELIHNYDYDDDFYMFHFKTIWCPFNLTQHDKALCVYAHNWQDYRRKPNVHSYDPSPCPNWKSTDFILNYEDGCPFKEKCAKCHGWKEHEYHPFNYKSKPCPNGKNCPKGRDCPHFHFPMERRTAAPNVINRVFRYAPRNRIVTNTFKMRSHERPSQSQSQSQNVNVNLSHSSVSTYPSLTFSQHENDSFLEQFPSLPEQLSNNPSRGGTLTMLNDAPPKTFPQNKKKEQNEAMDFRQRKQSYDFEIGRQRAVSNLNAQNIFQEVVPPGLEKNVEKVIQTKARRWSTDDEGGFNQGGGFHQESDRLFREIFMSSFKKESSKHEGNDTPKMGGSHDKEEERADVEFKNNLFLDKILENEDM